MTTQRNPISRRRFLTAAGAATAGLSLGIPALVKTQASAATPRFRANPFTLGVASGDPLPDSVVLWTRLAPDPLAEDGAGGVPEQDYQVQWELATDDQFSNVVQRGTQQATPKWAHSIHVEPGGLEPAREYFYRFRVGTDISPVGRTKTAPATGADVNGLSFAVASCQNFPAGYFPSHRDIVQQDPDFVLFLGDYIYEGSGQGELGRGHLPAKEIFTLPEYRVRYAQYKADDDLQAAHHMVPWVVTIDDHEVDNNWADELDGNDVGEGFLDRRAAAFHALYEHMPLRKSSLPNGPDIQIFRQVNYGNLATFFILDTRQYRDDQPQCDDADRIDGYCPGSLDPDLTIMGAEQREWLLNGLANSSARWNFVAQQTHFAPYDRQEGSGKIYGGGNRQDPWGDGYVAERTDVINAFEDTGISNPLVLSGDAHRNWAFDLKHDFADDSSATVGSEFLCTSVSSSGDTIVGGETQFGGTPDNPYQVFMNGQRGYIHVDLNADICQANYRVSETVTRPDAPLETIAAFAVEDGVPGAKRV